MYPTDSYPLARRDILTLAGLASISPFTAGAAQIEKPMPASRVAARRRELYALMGDLPPRNRPVRILGPLKSCNSATCRPCSSAA